MKRFYVINKRKAAQKPLAEPPRESNQEPGIVEEDSEPTDAQSSTDLQERLLRRDQERRDAEDAVTEYFAEQWAKLDGMAQLRAQRLARGGSEDKAKQRTVKQKR